MAASRCPSAFFFFTDSATPEIYTLSLHDVFRSRSASHRASRAARPGPVLRRRTSSRPGASGSRSEEHTSELQSHSDLVCRLLLEKKKNLDRRIVTHQRLEGRAAACP